MRKLTLGSLFDGSGGFALGGILSGINPIWASEIEPFPIRVTSKRLPSVQHLGDINQIDGAKITPVDIITFGSPCTDMSLAGRRAGLVGSQSVLFYQAIRIIKEMRNATDGKYPRYIVWENVPGAFSSNKGEDFKAELEAIAAAKAAAIKALQEKQDAQQGAIADHRRIIDDANRLGMSGRAGRGLVIFGGGLAAAMIARFDRHDALHIGKDAFDAPEASAREHGNRTLRLHCGIDGRRGELDDAFRLRRRALRGPWSSSLHGGRRYASPAAGQCSRRPAERPCRGS